jgi:hypothetical protein
VRDTADVPRRVWLSADSNHMLAVDAFSGDGLAEGYKVQDRGALFRRLLENLDPNKPTQQHIH